MFSTVVRHPVSLTSHAPVVFLQYLAALAIVEGIKTYDAGYKDLEVKLKWPNDICEYRSSYLATVFYLLLTKMRLIPHPRILSR